MTACATKGTLPETVTVGNLFLPLPDTDFREYLDEIECLAKSAPEIVAAIEKDLDVHSREEKKIRLEDKKYFASHTADLPKLDIKERNLLAEELHLAVGRPRMPGYVVYVFLMVRGFLGSLTSQPARRFLRESMSLYCFLQNRGLSMPAVTTMLENVNLVRNRGQVFTFHTSGPHDACSLSTFHSFSPALRNALLPSPLPYSPSHQPYCRSVQA